MCVRVVYICTSAGWGTEGFTDLTTRTGSKWRGWMNGRQMMKLSLLPKERKEKKGAKVAFGGWWSLGCVFSFRSSPEAPLVGPFQGFATLTVSPLLTCAGGWGWAASQLGRLLSRKLHKVASASLSSADAWSRSAGL